MFIRFITTGGTIDKIYFDTRSRFEVGESRIRRILSEALVTFDYGIEPLLQKDSLELSASDRAAIRRFIENDDSSRFVVTHGTDTMVQPTGIGGQGRALAGIDGKAIVLTGALSPARFRTSDAVFNVGMAAAAAQTVPPGVYIAMNGRLFAGDAVRKNRERNGFEALPGS